MSFFARFDSRSTCLMPVLILVLATIAMAGSATARDIDELQAELEARDASWTADDSFSKTLTPETRAALRGGLIWTEENQKEWEANLVWFDPPKDLPSYFDWRDTDGITPVKSQGECGSCWAFAAVGEVEALVKINYGVELNISEQQMISCNPYGSGCSGGWAGAAYYVMNDSQHGGIHEHAMPYQASDLPSCIETGSPSYAHLTGWHSVLNDVTQIKTALLNGPVCTAIDAGDDFENYGSGCYDVVGGPTNHLVLIVGWDDRLCSDQGAWIIKNSWGFDFGMSGYIYVKYGAGSVGTSCSQAYYTPPATGFTITSPASADSLIADELHAITWNTSGTAISYVDLFWSEDGYNFGLPLASDVPNTGSYSWMVPNDGTYNGHLLITVASGTRDGFGFSPELHVVGHKLRYVSAAGSDTPPYESVATAAHSINDAVQACTGLDSVLVATGDYLGFFTMNRPVRIFGGWNAAFTEMDPELYPTGVRGVQSAARIYMVATDYSGLYNLNFHDCQGGYYSEPETGNHGGAVYCIGGSPTISGCSFEDCVAASGTSFGLGGAILATSGSPIIENCTFTGNRATYGGAIMLLDSANARLSGNTFTGNSCVDSLGVSRGGAIYVDGGVLSLDGDSFNGNGGVQKGGAIALRQAQLTAVDVSLYNNRSITDGGAVYADTTEVTLSHMTITDNVAASSGGGMNCIKTTLNMSNVLFSGNTAAVMGGGMLAMAVPGGSITNSIFRDNTAPAMGAGAMVIADGEFSFFNNIVAENIGAGLMLSGDLVAVDYNNVWSNSGDDYSGISGVNDISADPVFVDVVTNDFGLGLHSPCVDRGLGDGSFLDPDASPADIGLLGGPGARMVAPVAVAGASVEDLSGGDYRLSWDANSEADLDYYAVYCDTSQIFTPSVDNYIAMVTPPTTILDVTPDGDCYYLIAAVDTDGYVGGYSSRLDVSANSAVGGDALPRHFTLTGAVPNPFNPMTTIAFDVPSQRRVEVRVYDLRGRMVSELLSATLEPGRYDVTWKGTDSEGAAVAAGVYVVRMTGDGESTTRKVVLAK